MNTFRLRSMFHQIDGWLSEKEASLLFTCATTDNAKVMAELGAWHGKSTLVLSEAAKETGGRVTSCDLWPEDVNSMEHYLFNLRRGCCMSRVDPVRGDYDRAARLFDDGSVDLVFFDGGHHYDSDVRTLKIWLEKLKVGGWLLCHDYYNPGWPDVKRAVDSVGDRLDQSTMTTADSLAGWRRAR